MLPALPPSLPLSRRARLRHVLLWFVPLLSWITTVLCAFLLFTGLTTLGPLGVLQEFPLNVLSGLLIGSLVLMLSVGAGAALAQYLCWWLTDKESRFGWHDLDTSIVRGVAAIVLLCMLLFATRPAGQAIGTAIMALGGGISGAWLSTYPQTVAAERRLAWMRAMFLTWGGIWVVGASLLYWNIG
jgi:hypothetical protein